MKNSLILKSLLLAGMVVLIVFLRLHYENEPLERDITTYAYVAHNMLEGENLYSELWDHKPPAIYGVFMLGELLFGYNQFAITALGIIFTLISGAFLYLFLDRITDSTTALLGAAFWALASNSIALQANQPNVELFMNTFTIMALWALAQAHNRKPAYMFVAGVFWGLVSLLKMIAIFPVFFIVVYLMMPLRGVGGLKWDRQQLKSVVIFPIPPAFIWTSTFIYFNVLGRFSEFWEAVFAYNRYYSQSILKNVTGFFISPNKMFHASLTEIWILVLLSIAWFGISKKEYNGLRRSFFIFFLLGSCIAVASPGYYYAHYYQLLLPSVCILAALFFHDAFRTIRGKDLQYGKAVLTGLVVFALGLTGMYQIESFRMSPEEISIKKYGPQFTQSYEIAKIVAKHTSDDDEIYVWGAETGIYFYSKRKSVTGITYIYPLLVGPQKVRLQKIRRVIRDISDSPPAVFVYNEAYGEIESNYFNALIKENYVLVDKLDNYLIFKSNKHLQKKAAARSGPQIIEDIMKESGSGAQPLGNFCEDRTFILASR